MALACFLAKKGLTGGEICCILKATHETYNQGKFLRTVYLQRTAKKAMETIEQEASVESGAQVGSPTGLAAASVDISLPGDGQLILTNLSRPSLPALLSFAELRELEIPEIEVIPTPLKFLNTYLHGGFGIGELAFLIAKQESGKTSMACAFAAHAVKQGFNALVVHYEDSFRALKKRYTSLFQEQGMSDVYFLNAVQHKTGLDEIQRAIEKVKPAFVVIDYFSRIPAPNSNKASESRFEAKHTTEALKAMAVALECAILVTDHVTILQSKTGNPYRIHDYMVAESKMYKLALVDIMIGLAKDNWDGTIIYASGMKFKREYSQMFQKCKINWATCEVQEF